MSQNLSSAAVVIGALKVKGLTSKFASPAGVYVNHYVCPSVQSAFKNFLLVPDTESYNRTVTRDFQQCGILTSVNSNEPVQPPFKLTNSK